MNKIIIPTGYMGSGSSAITDLISEYKGYDADNGSFEYVFMHCPNGLFDLEDKLLIGNNALRSDEALHSFYQEMNELYSRKFWWVGNYKGNVSIDFMKYTSDFIEELVDFSPNYYWYYQEKLTALGVCRMAIRKILLLFTGGRVKLTKPLTHKDMWLALPDEDEFYTCAKRYLNKIWEALGIKNKNLILDQLLLPFNVNRMSHYFDDNAECFIVQRDPRDVFISNKYVWTKQDCPIPYPTDVKQFCKMYRKMRQMEGNHNDSHIHEFQFEDLIYKYEEAVDRVEQILGLSSDLHEQIKTAFDPEKSIQNTQLFLCKEFASEIEVIEQELVKYLYDFPYKKEVNMDKVF